MTAEITTTEPPANPGSRAVVDGKLTYTSVSAITTFDPNQYGGCQRRWFYRYVAGLEEPTTVAQSTGTSGHKQIEHYLKTGEKTLGPVVMAGVEHIPEPGPDLLVEHYFNGELKARTPKYDVPLKGFIDLVNPRDGVEVRDWKFTGDLKNAKTGKQLLETVQMVGYGNWALDKFSVDQVRLTHVYFQTRGALDCRKSSILADGEDLRERWGRVESVVGEMVDVATIADPIKVPANTKACNAWGGCPHSWVCPKNEVSIMSLMDAIKSGMATATITEPARTVTTMEAPTVGILPADAPESKPELAAKPLEEPVTEAKTTKRGRPKKSETTTPTPVYETATATEPYTPGTATATNGLWVFVDVELAALPPAMKGMIEPLDTYIDRMCDALASQYGAADIRCASGDSPLGFGKWKGALAALVRNAPPEPGYYSVGWVRGNEIKETVVEALRPNCEMLVRGNR